MERILVVDDEPNVLQSLRRVLRRSGFEIATARSGEEALDLLSTFAPDVVLTDFRMEGMNGAALLAQVKTRVPTALRVMLSGYAELRGVAASVNEGEICRFIAKPWDDQQLVETLRTLLAQRDVRTRLERTFGGRPGFRVPSECSTAHRVELRFDARDGFDSGRAAQVLGLFAGALQQEGLALITGLLEHHGGTITFSGEFGGGEHLTLSLPVGEGGAVERMHPQ